MQRGFAWLDHTGELLFRREQLPLADALHKFLADFTKNANDWETIKTRIESQLKAAVDFAVAAPAELPATMRTQLVRKVLTLSVHTRSSKKL